MPAKINIGGVKHEISDMRFNVNGSSKDVTKVLLNVGGAKKEIFSSKFIYDGQIVSRRPIPAGNVMYGYGNGQGALTPLYFSNGAEIKYVMGQDVFNNNGTVSVQIDIMNPGMDNTKFITLCKALTTIKLGSSAYSLALLISKGDYAVLSGGAGFRFGKGTSFISSTSGGHFRPFCDQLTSLYLGGAGPVPLQLY